MAARHHALFAIVGLICAVIAQGSERLAPAAASSSSTPPATVWRPLLGQRAPSAASMLWAQTVSDFAAKRIDSEGIVARVDACLTLDPRFVTCARLGAMMASVHNHESAKRRVLAIGLRAAPQDPWFASTLALSLRTAPEAHPDLSAAYMSRAAQTDPELAALARRLRP